MPTYVYECSGCGIRYELTQKMTDPPETECKECGGNVHRVLVGGTGFIMKSGGSGHSGKRSGGCRLETEGVTCCGAKERCGSPGCGG